MRLLILFAAACLLGGCSPSTQVIKNPGPLNRGVRFYRPKPYLRIAPHQDSKGVASSEFVDLSVEYLPDFSEEYAIRICAGLGTNKTKVVLENGWNLTQLDVDIDAQFDENLKAIADLASKLPIATAAGEEPRPTAVRATNVPIGYYEAVIASDPCGARRLGGWRYVGFLPYAACGAQPCESCGDDSLYGLVFENGVMVFKPLVSLPAALDSNRTSLAAIDNAALKKVLSDVARAVPEIFHRATGVAISPNAVLAAKGDGQTVEVTVALKPQDYEKFAAGAATADDIAREIAPAAHRLFNDNTLNVRVVVAAVE